MPILLRKQKKHTSGKKQKWYRTPVMPPESMAQGKYTDQKASMIIPVSNQKLWMIFTPKTDNPERKRGKTAQWTARQ